MIVFNNFSNATLPIVISRVPTIVDFFLVTSPPCTGPPGRLTSAVVH